MATTYNDNHTNTPNGSNLWFGYTFPTIETTSGGANSEVKVALNGVTQSSTKYTVDSSSSPTRITFNTTSVDATVQESTGAPKTGVTVRVYRDTGVDTPTDLRHTFQAGSSIRATDLNNLYEHNLYALQEEQNQLILAEHIDSNAVTRAKIIADAVDGTKIADDSIDSEHYVNASIDEAHLASNSVTVDKIADTQLKDLANNLSSTAAELNQLDGKTVTGTFNAGNTNDIPTSSAINSFVVSQLDAVGAFIAIANEVSFPNANPDPEDDAGTVVSISDAAGIDVSSGGVSTDGRTLGGATVTITGFPSALQSKSFTEGMGLLVQTTGTLNTYTYHKAIAKDADIITLSDTVNSFNNRYRFGSDDPTDSLDDGDLFFNTSQDTFKVYNATDGAWQKTTPTAAQLSNIAICAGNTTYTNDLGLITDAVATSSEGSIDTVAGKITEIGRLGTADAVADLAILATTDVVSDLNTLATSDIVSDMNTLATSGNVTAMDNCSGSISNINTAAGSISNVNTVAGSIADVNRYANEYTIAGSAPGSPSEGDLWYDSGNNVLKYYTGSSWVGISDAGINDVVEDTSPQLGGNLDGQNNSLTSINDIAAVSLDISGNVDVDGTLETDALTIDGATLAETIADTVGAMVGSNTETGIAVTYEDGDNTLDFVVGTLNQDTTGTAAIATTVTVADESSDTTCFPLFSTAATGNLGPKSGSNLTFNSSTGDLTATLLNGGAGANLDLDFGSVA